MQPLYERARQEAFRDASDWLFRSTTVGDIAFLIASSAAHKRGEERLGFALGVLNAIETLSYRENA